MTDYEGRYLHQQFGNYRLVKLLGYGGFAEVYLGEHVHMGTQTAVKVLTARLTPEEIAHFRDEARTIFGLDHPNIVRVHDYGLNGNIPYIVMSYAANGSLRTRHPRGTRVPLPTVVEYVKQIAAGLQYAHNEGLVHRDIKPDNMLIGKRNDILLSDFGVVTISSSIDSNQFQNQTGTGIYMAPEQIQMHPVRASDQYALGIMVYEWLCGKPPFESDRVSPLSIQHIQLMNQHLNAAPPPLCEHISDILSSVEAVVMKSLAKDPKARFGSVHEFAEKLEEASKKPPIGTTLLKYDGHGDGWSAFAWSPDGRYMAVGNEVGDVQLWDVVNWVLICTWGEHDGPVKIVAWSPDGQRVASGSSDKVVQVWDISTGQSLFSYHGRKFGVYELAWSPDGRWLASGSEGVQVWDANTGQSIFSYPSLEGYLSTLAWSPDESRLASVSEYETVQVWEDGTGQSLFASQYVKGPGSTLAWSSDGRLASVCVGGTVQIWSDDGITFRSHEGQVSALAWSPDGTRIASGSYNVVEIWETGTGQILFTYRGHEGEVSALAWSPDGTRIASGSYRVVQVWQAL